MNYSKNILLSILLLVLLEKSHQQSSNNIFRGYYKLIKTKNCSKNLEVNQPNANGEWPAKVISSKYDTNWIDNRVELKITWTANIKNVKGFKIILKPSGKSDICRILDYTDSISSSSLGKNVFEFKLSSIYQFINFTAELSPLPNRGDDSSTLISKFDTVDCSQFSPKFTQDYDGRILKVTFSKGPNICNYKKYEIGVYKDENNITEQIVPTQENVDQLQAYFQLHKLNICRGNYFIMASVFEDTMCNCKNNQQQCKHCIYTKSKDLYLVPAKSCSSKIFPREQKELSPNIFLLGIVMVLPLIALALVITYWKLSVHLMVKKRGIVLFLDDHEHHTNAVTKLINYLNESHLKVLLASTFVKNHDIPDQLVLMAEFLKSDFVLLVLSSALQKRMAAWEKHQDYVDFFKEKNSNIINKTLLEMLLISNKLYVCNFDHVTKFGKWPAPCYSLPSNLTNMVADLNGQSYSQRLVLCNCLKSNALRDEFQTAFKKAFTYEQSHANWFQEKYVCPTNVAVYNVIADEMSQETLSQSVKPSALELKDLFIGYKNNNPDLPEESIIAPSVFSEGISEKLEAVNNRNL